MMEFCSKIRPVLSNQLTYSGRSTPNVDAGVVSRSENRNGRKRKQTITCAYAPTVRAPAGVKSMRVKCTNSCIKITNHN